MTTNYKMRKTRTAYHSSDEDFIKAVKENQSIRSVILTLGYIYNSSNFRAAKKRIEELQLDTSHFTGKGHLKGKTHEYGSIPLEELLLENPEHLTKTLKNRLLKAGLLKNECYICELGTVWQGKPITLQMDHINGNRVDNRLENLRILCPNCHSQTDTYCSRNKVKSTFAETKKCKDCKTAIYYASERCRPCENIRKKNDEKYKKEFLIDRKGNPINKGYDFSYEETKIMYEEVIRSNISRVARKYGISRSALRDAFVKRGLYSGILSTRDISKMPPREELASFMNSHNVMEASEHYNVIVKTIINWCNQFNIKII